MSEINFIKRATFSLAKASKGNPITSTCTIMLFFLMFNIVEAVIEKLIFGERFEHWLDPVFGCLFIGYAAYAVYFCGVYNHLTEADKD